MIRKALFFEVWSWFKFHHLGSALFLALKFYTSVAKEMKIRVKNFWKLIPTFVEVTWEKTGRRAFCPSIMNKVETRPYRNSKKNRLHTSIVRANILQEIQNNTMHDYNLRKNYCLCKGSHHFSSFSFSTNVYLKLNFS